MRSVYDTKTPHPELGRTTVAIGIFDGVHRGHQKLLQHGQSLAQGERLKSLALTYYPHPAQVLRPADAPKLIEPLHRRLARLEALHCDVAWVQPFDLEFARTAPENFVHAVLVDKMQAKHVIVGQGFSFGRKQSGNVALLQSMGQAHDFLVHEVPLLQDGAANVSSSRIRACIATGALLDAARLLGRPPMWEGKVVHGAHRGKALGFGTANLSFENELAPALGVYAGQTQGPFGQRPAVVNVGIAPTFGEAHQTRMEVHLLDYDGSPLYDAHLEVALFERLRGEQKFPDVEALKAQIAADAQQAAALMRPRS